VVQVIQRALGNREDYLSWVMDMVAAWDWDEKDYQSSILLRLLIALQMNLLRMSAAVVFIQLQ